jgi:hypothetical protein
VTPSQLAHARHIVTHPWAHTARVRLLAWAILKTAQGKPMRQSLCAATEARDA